MSESIEVYLCPSCRTALFTADNRLHHEVSDKPSNFKDEIYSSTRKTCTQICIDYMKWMGEEAAGENMSGKIYCPKCSAKLGNFNLYGSQCTCGTWVAPSFFISENRIDKINIPRSSLTNAGNKN